MVIFYEIIWGGTANLRTSKVFILFGKYPGKGGWLILSM